MKVVLVQWPACWISIVECLVIYNAMAPLACNGCELTLDLSKPLSFDFLISTASLMAFIMSLLCTCCHAIFGLSLKVQINVSCCALSLIMSVVHVMRAWTGQQGFLFFKAWCDKVWPQWLFFWLSIVIDTRSTFSVTFRRFSG